MSSNKPKHEVEYAFGGSIGVLGVSIGCPLTTWAFYFVCNEAGCPTESFLRAPLNAVKNDYWPRFLESFELQAFAAYCAWFLFCVALCYILPANLHDGVLLRNGTRLEYRMNGMGTFYIITAICGGGTAFYGFDWVLWRYIWDNQLQLMSAAFVFSFLLACYVYLNSFISGELLAEGGDTGSVIYDWFIGRPLNPRLGSFDIKQFCEQRPGLIMWNVFNFAYLAHQYVSIGRITDSMILVNIFQYWYIFDTFWNEPAVLTTMDITHDGFGFMLCMGDLLWVPFTYTLQARYLAMHPVDLGLWGIAGVLVVQLSGYKIFRGANSQKNAFRRNPDSPEVQHLQYMKTKSGSKLLITGWWGIARHINYFGDWLMGLGWCLPTGFSTPISYFYAIYFAVLLLHRETRDEAKCKAKYGQDWEVYKKKVPWRIIPYVY